MFIAAGRKTAAFSVQMLPSPEVREYQDVF